MKQSGNGKKIISGMFWRFGERITAQLISFVVSVILAHILIPEDYGVIAIVNVFIAILDVLVTSGISTSLIQKKDVTQLDFSTIFYCSIMLSAVLYVGIYWFAPIIAAFYGMPILTPVIRVFALKIPISAVNSVQNAYVSRQMDFKKFFWATLIGTVISAFVGIGMALSGAGVWALVAQYLTNSAIDTIVLFMVVGWRPTFEFSKDAAKPLFSYGWKILVTDLIGTIFNQLNAFVIGKKYTSAELAYYTQGKKFPDIIDNNIGNTLNAVLFPAMSQASDLETIQKIRRQSLKMMAYIMFPLMIGMYVVAENMVLVLLTEKWLSTVFFIRIACINAMINVMGATSIQEIKAIGRSDITLKMELVKKPIFLLILIVSMHYGVKGVAVSLPITAALAFVLNVIPVKKLIGFDFKMHFLDILPILTMSLIMGGIVYLLSFSQLQKNILILLQVIAGAVVYIGLSLATKNDTFFYLIHILKERIHNDER